MGKHSTSIDSQILDHLLAQGHGWVFTPRHFASMGSRDAVASALKRYKAQGIVRQIARGLYDFPVVDPVLGIVPPSVDAIAEAISFRDAISIQPAGAHAANLLGLSSQVPARVVYLTDGRTQKVVIGKREIIFKHTTPKNMAVAGTISGIVFQALRYYGQDGVDEQTLTTIRRQLSTEDLARLETDIIYAPAWVAQILRPWFYAEVGA